MLEPSFVLSGLNRIFNGHSLVFRAFDPGERRWRWSAPFAPVLGSTFDVRLDLLPVCKVPLNTSNPFNQPRDCLVGRPLVSFVDLRPRSPRPFWSSLVLKRNTADQNCTRVCTPREGSVNGEVLGRYRECGIFFMGGLEKSPFSIRKTRQRIGQTWRATSFDFDHTDETWALIVGCLPFTAVICRHLGSRVQMIGRVSPNS